MVSVIKIALFLTVVVSLSGCAVGKGMKLALDCKTDEAVTVLDGSSKGDGLTGRMALLEKEAVLREAGRIDEAEAVRVKRESAPGMTEQDKTDAEKAIQETIQNIRSERQKQTGIATCP